MTPERARLALTLPQHMPDLVKAERVEIFRMVDAGLAVEWPPASRRYVLTTPGAEALVSWLRAEGHHACADAFLSTRPDARPAEAV